jgi:hypothetical protein
MEINFNIDDIQYFTDAQLEAWQIALEPVAIAGFKADLLSAIKTEIETRKEDWFGSDLENDGQPSWEQEWSDFGEVYDDSYGDYV